jgi:hypothetical protein
VSEIVPARNYYGDERQEAYTVLVTIHFWPRAMAFPGRGAACNAAPLIRDRSKFRVRDDPGSAAHHFVLRRAREKNVA